MYSLKVLLEAENIDLDDKNVARGLENDEPLTEPQILRIKKLIAAKLNSISDTSLDKELGKLSLNNLKSLSRIPLYGKYYIDPAQTNSEQGKGTSAYDFAKYKSMQIVPFFVYGKDGENYNAENSRESYNLIFLVPAIGVEISDDNMEKHKKYFGKQKGFKIQKKYDTLSPTQIADIRVTDGELGKVTTSFKTGNPSSIPAINSKKASRRSSPQTKVLQNESFSRGTNKENIVDNYDIFNMYNNNNKHRNFINMNDFYKKSLSSLLFEEKDFKNTSSNLYLKNWKNFLFEDNGSSDSPSDHEEFISGAIKLIYYINILYSINVSLSKNRSFNMTLDKNLSITKALHDLNQTEDTATKRDLALTGKYLSDLSEMDNNKFVNDLKEVLNNIDEFVTNLAGNKTANEYFGKINEYISSNNIENDITNNKADIEEWLDSQENSQTIAKIKEVAAESAREIQRLYDKKDYEYKDRGKPGESETEKANRTIYEPELENVKKSLAELKSDYKSEKISASAYYYEAGLTVIYYLKAYPKKGRTPNEYYDEAKKLYDELAKKAAEHIDSVSSAIEYNKWLDEKFKAYDNAWENLVKVNNENIELNEDNIGVYFTYFLLMWGSLRQGNLNSFEIPGHITDRNTDVLTLLKQVDRSNKFEYYKKSPEGEESKHIGIALNNLNSLKEKIVKFVKQRQEIDFNEFTLIKEADKKEPYYVYLDKGVAEKIAEKMAACVKENTIFKPEDFESFAKSNKHIETIESNKKRLQTKQQDWEKNHRDRFPVTDYYGSSPDAKKGSGSRRDEEPEEGESFEVLDVPDMPQKDDRRSRSRRRVDTTVHTRDEKKGEKSTADSDESSSAGDSSSDSASGEASGGDDEKEERGSKTTKSQRINSKFFNSVSQESSVSPEDLKGFESLQNLFAHKQLIYRKGLKFLLENQDESNHRVETRTVNIEDFYEEVYNENIAQRDLAQNDPVYSKYIRKASNIASDFLPKLRRLSARERQNINSKEILYKSVMQALKISRTEADSLFFDVTAGDFNNLNQQVISSLDNASQNPFATFMMLNIRWNEYVARRRALETVKYLVDNITARELELANQLSQAENREVRVKIKILGDINKLSHKNMTKNDTQSLYSNIMYSRVYSRLKEEGRDNIVSEDELKTLLDNAAKSQIEIICVDQHMKYDKDIADVISEKIKQNRDVDKRSNRSVKRQKKSVSNSALKNAGIGALSSGAAVGLLSVIFPPFGIGIGLATAGAAALGGISGAALTSSETFTDRNALALKEPTVQKSVDQVFEFLKSFASAHKGIFESRNKKGNVLNEDIEEKITYGKIRQMLNSSKLLSFGSGFSSMTAREKRIAEGECVDLIADLVSEVFDIEISGSPETKINISRAQMNMTINDAPSESEPTIPSFAGYTDATPQNVDQNVTIAEILRILGELSKDSAIKYFEHIRGNQTPETFIELLKELDKSNASSLAEALRKLAGSGNGESSSQETEEIVKEAADIITELRSKLGNLNVKHVKRMHEILKNNVKVFSKNNIEIQDNKKDCLDDLRKFSEEIVSKKVNIVDNNTEVIVDIENVRHLTDMVEFIFKTSTENKITYNSLKRLGYIILVMIGVMNKDECKAKIESLTEKSRESSKKDDYKEAAERDYARALVILDELNITVANNDSYIRGSLLSLLFEEKSLSSVIGEESNLSDNHFSNKEYNDFIKLKNEIKRIWKK